jgi:CbiX
MSAALSKTVCLVFFGFAIASSGQTASAQSGRAVVLNDQRTGILLLAHGGSNDWNANVEAIAAEVNKSEATEVAFGMADRATLQVGIDKLTARGVSKIVAVPLFVSSHSSVIDATKYLLGLRPDAPPELMDFTMDHAHGDSSGAAADKVADDKLKSTPVTCNVPLQMTAALDRHPILADILTERASAMSREPKKEVVVLVAHGPNDDVENELWLSDLRSVALMVAVKRPFARVEATTIRDDADAPVRDQATATLRTIVQTVSAQGYRALIVPVLLSYGGIENGIRQRLDGLDHVMSPSGLLPDPRIVDWVNASSRLPLGAKRID